MKAGWAGISCALVVMTVLTASPANATSITYVLNQSGTGPVGNAGTITLNDAGDNSVEVQVTVTLNAGYEFVQTGSGDALAFNILGDPAITIEDITPGFAIDTTPKGVPFGAFHYSVRCDDSGCGNGGSHPNPGPLSFEVHLAGITVDRFVANDAGFFFASDLIGPDANGVRVTGNVGANGLVITTTDVTPVPEPASLLLFGSGLIGTVYKWRRKRRAAEVESI